MIRTYAQFKADEYAALREEYPEASCHDCHELADSPSRRQDWVDEVTAAMRIGTPTGHQWPRLIHELGRDYILRRVFHDAPDSGRRYLDAGLLLPCPSSNPA